MAPMENQLRDAQLVMVILKLFQYVTDVGYIEVKQCFQCYISHVTTSETEIKLFQPPKLFQNYFSVIKHVGKYQ